MRFTSLRFSVSACAACIFAVLSTSSFAQNSAPPILQINLNSGQQLFGLPIHWSRLEAVLLESTGRMHYMEQTDVASHQMLKHAFVPQSPSDARNQLQQELGNGFEILVHGKYVVAAPTGHAARWRDRFHSLLAGYMRYFESRGWAVRSPDFPMLVLVFPDRQSFAAYCSRESQSTPANVVGSYYPKSNRCVLYERESSFGIDWAETEATIVHEAVHQMAYNTGIHERLFENPLWLVEGLATVFEQPAVYDLRMNRSTVENRMLPSRLASIQPLVRDANALEAHIRSLIESDRLFRQNPELAYSLSWALLFYLSERMPNEFGELMRTQSQRGFGAYSAGSRVADFRNATRIDTVSLALQMQRLFQK